MNKRILTVLLIFVLILGVGIVSAENLESDDSAEPVQTIDADIGESNVEDIESQDIEMESESDNEVLSSSSEVEILEDEPYYLENGFGSQVVDFNNGYRAFCLNSSLAAASEKDTYFINDNAVVKNERNNEEVSNYIKWIFYEYYDLAKSSEREDTNVIQSAIWAFVNYDYNGPVSSNERVQSIVDYVREMGRYEVLNDDYQVKTVGDNELIFSFKVFVPADQRSNIQSYFGFKYETRHIEPDNDKIEELDEPINNNTQTNTTNETDVSNSTDSQNNVTNETNSDETPESNPTSEEQSVENTTTPADVKNDETEPVIETEDNSTESAGEKQDSKAIIQSISNATGNPLAILMVILAVLGLYPSLRRKD